MLIPIELVTGVKYAGAVALVTFLVSGLGPGGYSLSGAVARGTVAASLCALAFFGGAAVSLQKLRFKHTNLFAAMRGAMTSYSLVLNVRLNYLYAISGLAMIAAAGRLCHGYEIVSVGYFLASSIYLYPEHQRLIEELSTNEGSMP